jgi:hypothetical protein
VTEGGRRRTAGCRAADSERQQSIARAALGRAATVGEIRSESVDARVETIVPIVVAFNLLVVAGAPARETRELLAAVLAVADVRDRRRRQVRRAQLSGLQLVCALAHRTPSASWHTCWQRSSSSPGWSGALAVALTSRRMFTWHSLIYRLILGAVVLAVVIPVWASGHHRMWPVALVTIFLVTAVGIVLAREPHLREWLRRR